MKTSDLKCIEQKDGRCSSTATPCQPIPIRLINGEDLARELLFESPTSAFRKFCRQAGIEPVPGRRDCYDPLAVRHKLNEIQGLGSLSDIGPQAALTNSVMRRNG